MVAMPGQSQPRGAVVSEHMYDGEVTVPAAVTVVTGGATFMGSATRAA